MKLPQVAAGQARRVAAQQGQHRQRGEDDQQIAAGYQGSGHGFHVIGLEEPALVVALLGPGVGEVHVDPGDRGGTEVRSIRMLVMPRRAAR